MAKHSGRRGGLLTTKTKAQLQREACLKRAREYRLTARSLYRAIDDLDRDDPESRDAARVWSMQAHHAECCAAEAERYADYAMQGEES